MSNVALPLFDGEKGFYFLFVFKFKLEDKKGESVEERGKVKLFKRKKVVKKDVHSLYCSAAWGKGCKF